MFDNIVWDNTQDHRFQNITKHKQVIQKFLEYFI
jgi:predicted esterase YcpF (UPF0227 family)